MENLWNLIAYHRGLQLGEKFVLIEDEKFDERCLAVIDAEHGLMIYKTYEDEYGEHGNWMIRTDTHGFISGKTKMIKLDYQPKNGETFWTIHGDKVDYFIWNGSDFCQLKRLGNIVFRTKEEAEKALKGVLIWKTYGK